MFISLHCPFSQNYYYGQYVQSTSVAENCVELDVLYMILFPYM